METTKKKLSIDELARRLSNEFVPENLDKEMWRRESNDWIASWHRVVRLARKLEAQPAAKPRPEKQKTLADLPYIEVVVHQPIKTEGCEVTWSVAEPRPAEPKLLVCEACGKSKRDVCERATFEGEVFISCEPCWCSVPAKVFNKRVAASRAKAAAKKARK